jgi:hypothetical protein
MKYFRNLHYILHSRDSSVSIALGYGLDDRSSRIRFLAGAGRIFLFTTAPGTALGPTQPPIQWVPRALSLGVMRRHVKLTTHLHLVPRSKNAWSYTSTPQYAFMAWCSVKRSAGTNLPLPSYFLPLYITAHCFRSTDLPSVGDKIFGSHVWVLKKFPARLLKNFICWNLQSTEQMFLQFLAVLRSDFTLVIPRNAQIFQTPRMRTRVLSIIIVDSYRRMWAIETGS